MTPKDRAKRAGKKKKKEVREEYGQRQLLQVRRSVPLMSLYQILLNGALWLLCDKLVAQFGYVRWDLCA